MSKYMLVVSITAAVTLFSAISKAGDIINYACQGHSKLAVDYAADGKTAHIVSDTGRQGLGNTFLTAQPAESGKLFTGQLTWDPKFRDTKFTPAQLQASLVKLNVLSHDKVTLAQGDRFFECKLAGLPQ